MAGSISLSRMKCKNKTDKSVCNFILSFDEMTISDDYGIKQLIHQIKAHFT